MAKVCEIMRKIKGRTQRKINILFEDGIYFSAINDIANTGNVQLTRFQLAWTLVNMVYLFVTMAQLARGQTSVSTVKIGAIGEKLVLLYQRV